MAVLSYEEVQGSKGQVFLIPRLGLPRCHFFYILLAKQSQSQSSQRNEAQALTLMEGVARVYRVGWDCVGSLRRSPYTGASHWD